MVALVLTGCASVAVSIGLASSQSRVGLPKYDMEKLPYRGQWGEYAVTVETDGKEDFAPQLLRILNSRGEVLREVRDQKISLVEEVDLTGAPPKALRVTGFSGGAHCCSTDYFFTRGGELKNVLIYAGANGGIVGIKPIGKDPRPHIIASSDSLAYFGDLPYAASPWTTLIIGWDGKQYVDQTRAFPDRSRMAALNYRKDLFAARARRDDFAEDTRRSAAAGYYGNAYIIGAGAPARAWIMKNAPARTRSWFVKYEKQLQKAVTGDGKRLSVSQAKVLKPPEQ